MTVWSCGAIEESGAAEIVGKARRQSARNVVFLRLKQLRQALGVESVCTLLLPQHTHHHRTEQPHEALRSALAETGVPAHSASERGYSAASQERRERAETAIDQVFRTGCADDVGDACEHIGRLLRDGIAKLCRASRLCNKGGEHRKKRRHGCGHGFFQGCSVEAKRGRDTGQQLRREDIGNAGDQICRHETLPFRQSPNFQNSRSCFGAGPSADRSRICVLTRAREL